MHNSATFLSRKHITTISHLIILDLYLITKMIATAMIILKLKFGVNVCQV